MEMDKILETPFSNAIQHPPVYGLKMITAFNQHFCSTVKKYIISFTKVGNITGILCQTAFDCTSIPNRLTQYRLY